MVLAGFIRIITRSRTADQPIDLATAVSIVDEWLQFDNVTPIDAGTRHWELFKSSLLTPNVTGQDATDAHIAALAREHRAVLYTNDIGFQRFEGVKLKNPAAT